MPDKGNLNMQIRQCLLSLLIVQFLLISPARSADSVNHTSLHRSAIKLYGEVDVVISSCNAAGITLSSSKLPATISKVRLGSPAYYANVQEKDKVLSGEISDKQMSLLIERSGQRYSVRLATAPTNQPGLLKASAQIAPFSLGDQANQISVEAYRNWIQKTHPQFVAHANAMDRRLVLDVEGQFDETAQTLEAFGIPYTRIAAETLVDYPVDKVHVIIVNCPGRVPHGAYQRLHDFVEKGGYLLTTDWTLNNYLSLGFPGYVEWDMRINRRSNYDAVTVGCDPVLFSNAVASGPWHMDSQCHLLKVLDSRVKILVRSQSLNEEDPNGQGVLAVTFSVGNGKILHLVGHFGKSFGRNLPDIAPQIGISLRQAIAGNFVVDGVSK
jgi:hypothetical protein